MPTATGTTPTPALNTHHIILSALRDERFFRLLMPSGWIDQAHNLINLSNNAATAGRTGTPLHQSGHPWILEVQRGLFENFMQNRTFGGHSALDLANNPSLSPAAYTEMITEARRYAEHVRDATGRALANGEIFLTHGDVRAPVGGLDARRAELERAVTSRFNNGQIIDPNAADIAAFRNQRASLSDPVWSAFDTPERVTSLGNAVPDDGWTNRASRTSFNDYARSVGVENFSRYSPQSGFEYRYGPTGSPPAGAGWSSDTEARSRAPQTTRDVWSRYDEALRDVERRIADPGSFAPNGDMSPEARAASRAAATLGIAAGVYDFKVTAEDVARRIQQGDYAGAAAEIGAFMARIRAGYAGAVVGAEIGFFFAGPGGAFVGSILGGILGATLGDELFRDLADFMKDLGKDLGDAIFDLFPDWLPDLFGPWFSNRDPLVLDLNGNGVSLTALSTSTAYFDLDGNGFAERTGWVSAGEGLLALDGNRNGRIDGGSELFGTATQNGFEVLARYDDNRDGRITSADAVWSSLLVWRDANGDGVSTTAELTGIAANDVSAIDLSPRGANFREATDGRAGNPLLAVGNYTQTNGFDAEAIAVAFTTDQTNTRFVPPDGFAYDSDVFELPNLRGYGALPDLWTAMTLDPELKAMVQSLVAGDYDDIGDLVGEMVTIKDPDYYRYGFLQTGDTHYHYQLSAFEAMLARWAGIPLDAGLSGEQIAELTTERLLGRAILDDRGAGNPAFHYSFLQLSNQFATRFVVGMADIAENRTALTLFSDILSAAGDGSTAVDPAVLQGLIDQALLDAGNAPELSPLLQRFAALNYDFGSDSIGGDVAAFLDAELQDFAFDPAHPYAGWGDWVAQRLLLLDIVDPDGSMLDERRRAYTGNRMLGLFNSVGNGLTNAISGDGILRGDVAGTSGLDVLSGSSGNDVLMGGNFDDAYIFTDGFGQDVVVDSSGNSDEIAFQGGLTSALAQVSVEGAGGRDLRIGFEGRPESVLIRGYFDAQGNPTIERITFPDGPLWDGEFVRNAALALLATDGDDIITGTLSNETLLGGAGNDNLVGNGGNDIVVGGLGNDVLSGSVFRFARGDGHDVIADTSGFSVIEFDDSVREADVIIRFSPDGSAIVLTVGGADQSITMNRLVARVQFSNSVFWDSSEILDRAQAGTSGDDLLFSFGRVSEIDGEAGNDRLVGSLGGDILLGGAGHDVLSGGGGADEYRFSLGDGHDTITLDSAHPLYPLNGTKIIAFDNSVASGSVNVRQGADGLSLILTVDGQDQSITISDFRSVRDRNGANDNSVQVRFADGTTWNWRQLFTLATTATNGDDRFFGSAQNDTLSGGAGDDYLVGNQGFNVLTGGTGDDYLRGGNGGVNSYRIARGDGHDTIEFSEFTANGENILFDDSIARTDVLARVAANGLDIVLTISGTNQTVTIRNAMTETIFEQDRLQFADGTHATIGDLLAGLASGTEGADSIFGSYRNATLVGGGGNDVLRGGVGDEIIDGGAGDDSYSGGAGSNIYRFGIGSGADTLEANEAFVSSQDSVEFGLDILPEDIDVSASSDGTYIILSIYDTADQLRIERNAEILRTGTFRFDDNTVWTAADLFLAGFEATEGDDVIFGPPGGGLIEGLGGDDNLVAGPSGDESVGNAGNVFVGGRGDDRIEGNLRDTDTYQFNRGDGWDTIVDSDFRGVGDGVPDLEFNNILEFGEGISESDVGLFRYADGIVIIIEGSDDRIYLENIYEEWEEVISEIRFADGSSLNWQVFTNRLKNGGQIEGNVLAGNGGNQTLDSAGIIRDVRGNGGNDTFIFNRGYGELRIDQSQILSFFDPPSAFSSTLRFGADISVDDVAVSTNDDGDLILSVGNTNQITVLRGRSEAPRPFDGEFSLPFSGVTRFEFADGTVWSYQDAIIDMYTGAANNVILVGDEFGGTFDPAGYAREIFSTSVNDQFIYNRGYGSVRIQARYSTEELYSPFSEASPSLQFGDGLSIEAAILSLSEEGTLTIDFGNGDVIEMVNMFSADRNREDFVGGVPNYIFGEDIYYLDELVEFANEQAVATDSGLPITQLGDSNWDYFDPAGVGDFVQGGGGRDIVVYERGYGEITVDVHPDLGDRFFFDRNAIAFWLGEGIVSADMTFRTGGENEIIVDFGNGDIIHLQFERDPALDLVTRPDYDGAVYFNFFDDTELTGAEILQRLDLNDTVAIGIGDFSANVVSNASEALVLAGQFSFSDADAADEHAVIIREVSVQGTSQGLPDNAQLLSYLFAQISDESAAGSEGQARWIFSADSSTFDFLADGETVTLDYVLEFSDGRMGLTQQTVSIVVNGTNQAPQILGGVSGATLLPANAQLGANGQIGFADVDLTDSHSITVESVAIAGNAAGLPSIEEVRNWLGTNLVAGATGQHSLNWTFAPQGHDFAALGLTDQLSLTYSVQIRDASGAVATRNINIVVRSSALAAGALAPASGIAFQEDAVVDLAIPATLFANSISGNLLVSASLSDGSPLPEWLHFDGSRLTGTPSANFSGVVDLRITANNGTDAVHDFLPLVIQAVNDAPTVTENISDYRIAADAAVDILLPQNAFVDVDGDPLQLSATMSDGTRLPAWLRLTDGGFVGTPPSVFSGTLAVTVTASDGVLSANQSINLVFGSENAAPSVANSLYDWQIREDEVVDIALRQGVFQDIDGDSLTISASLASGAALPDWMVFDGVRFLGTPPANFNGQFDIAVTASDGLASVTDNFRLIIDPLNDSPIVSRALANVSVATGANLDIAVPADSFVDVDGDILALSVQMTNGDPLPNWLLFDGSRITGTPPAGVSGDFALRVLASDGSLSVANAFILTISPLNSEPVALPDIFSAIDEDTSFEIAAASLLANDTDADSDTLSITTVSDAVGGMVELLESGAIRFTTTPNFNGPASFRYTISDGQGGVSAAVASFAVVPQNDAPVAVGNDGFVTNEDIPLEIALATLLANDSDVDGDTLSISAIEHSFGGNATLDGNLVRFTPAANYYGDASFTYRVSDGQGGSSTALVNLRVLPINDPPIVLNDIADFAIDEDGPVAVTLPSDAFVDVDGDALTFAAQLSGGGALPSWLVFDGTSLSGQPPANFNGTLAITITATDGQAMAGQQLFLTVGAVNDAPQLVSSLADVHLIEDTYVDIAIPIGSFADVDGDALTYAATLANGAALPSWLALDAANLRLTGTPPANFNGILDIIVTASDGALSVSDDFRLTITAQNDAPTVATLIPDVTASEDSFVDFILPANSFADVDGDSLSYSASLANGDGLPAWLSFDAATRRFTGTPPVNFNGPIEVRVTASDGTLSVSDDFHIEIAPVNDTPIVAIALADRAVNEDSAIDFTIPAGSFADVDGDALSLSATLASGAVLPTWLAFDAETGRFTGTPPANFNGAVDIRVTASGGSLTASDEFRLAIAPVNDAPVAANDGTYVTTSGNPITIGAASLLANDSDVDGNALSISSVGSAVGGSVAISAAGDIVFTPSIGFAGNASFQYTLSDGALSSQASVAVRVDAADPFATWRQGTNGIDILLGDLFEANRIFGRAGHDLITGGLLADQLAGGDGNDILTGLSGNDEFWGGSGNDTLFGGGGTDTAYYYGARSSYALITQGGILRLRVTDNQPLVDGDDGSDQLSSIERLSFIGGETVNVTSPIILDLDGNGVETLSASASSARYDLDGDGITDDTSWIGRTEGFLFLDRDGNGTVTNVGEFSFIDDVEGAGSDLEGLRAFDSNRDGILSTLDARFSEFRVWQDRDGDGAAEAGEILSLTAAGVRSINLTGTAVNGTTAFGDVAVVNSGSYTRTNGATMSFLDAALTYFSSATNVPSIAVQELDFTRRSGRYTINFAGGAMTINPNRERGTVDARAGALGASALLSFSNQTIGMLSPIILDLDGDGVEMRSIRQSRASFDMNGDGAADDTGWVGRGDGFLVIDRNNDGRITHASELSFASEDPDAVSDLEALAALDNNGDRVLDANDVRFGELKVWVDADGDGVTDAGELKSLEELGISSISLAARNLEGRAGVGDNVLLGTSTFTRSNGSTGTVGNAVLAYRPGTGDPSSSATAASSNLPFEVPLDGPVGSETVGGDRAPLPSNIDLLLAALRSGSSQFSASSLFQTPTGVDPFAFFETQPAFESNAIIPTMALDATMSERTPGVISNHQSANSASEIEAPASLSSSDTDRLLALIRQDMATFGVTTGANNNPWRKDNMTRPMEYFA